MGSNKVVKKMKKNKKRFSLENIQNGETGLEASPTEYDDKQKATVKIAEDISEADLKAGKFKKAHKKKRNDTLTSNELAGELSQEDVNTSVSDDASRGRKDKSRKAHKERKNQHMRVDESKSQQDLEEAVVGEVYEISSGEEDCSQGMKKWIKEYHDRRPGLKVLQQTIDDFIAAHEEQEEQARREREAKMAEEGWTVVVHHKGGKKTTDPESGVAVGSVAEVAVREKMGKKKSNDVGLDFYRFQKKEAQRSEIMKLQGKFEEDKKRIQQLRAARKFRPY